MLSRSSSSKEAATNNLRYGVIARKYSLDAGCLDREGIGE